jgi:succinoglycan biosynthesis transport protein ExoP
VKNERLVQLNRDITQAESMLAAAREQYKEGHPDIRRLTAQLNLFKAQRDTLEKQELQQQQSTPASEKSRRVTNPQVARALEDMKGQVAAIETLIRTKDLDLKEKMRLQTELQNKIQSYQARIDISPINEQRYQVLIRDHAMAKQSYEEMMQKTRISETAKDMEDRKAGENLEVLDPASLPEVPTEPNRLIIATVGTGIGFVLGIFLAGAKEMKDSSLKNLKDVRAYTNLAVLSSIPLLENALLVRRKRRLFWLAWTSAVIVGTIAMSGSMYYYYFGRT